MKAAFNGALNISILDGWWDEAYSPGTGWAIGQGEEYADDEYRDRVEANALFDLLENEVVPLFYRRGSDDLPRGWIALMRTAMASLCPVFNTNRMLHEYVVKGYAAANERRQLLEEHGFRRARELACWKDKVRKAWHEVEVTRVEVAFPELTVVGEHVVVRAWIRTGILGVADLVTQVYLGRLHEARDIVDPEIRQMEPQDAADGDGVMFHASIPCRTSGTQGLTVRVMPHHPDLCHPHEMGLIAWAK
jgi:starch phosphorylase